MGTNWDRNQSRSHNAANEITSISAWHTGREIDASTGLQLISQYFGFVIVDKMTAQLELLLIAVKKSFRDVRAPMTVSGDPLAIEASSEQVRRLLSKPLDKLGKEDFKNYLGYFTTGSPIELRYLLPACLRIWGSEVLSIRKYVDRCDNWWACKSFCVKPAQLLVVG